MYSKQGQSTRSYPRALLLLAPRVLAHACSSLRHRATGILELEALAPPLSHIASVAGWRRLLASTWLGRGLPLKGDRPRPGYMRSYRTPKSFGKLS